MTTKSMILKFGPLTGYLFLPHGWLRVFGYGIGWKDTRYVSLLFSEHNGLVKTWRIGHYSFKYLPRRTSQPISPHHDT